MITWNAKDFNVGKIVVESGILDVEMLFNTYRIYGTLDKENDVTIGFLTEVYPLFAKKINKLSSFLKTNDINHCFVTNEDFHWKQKHILRIGLNSDTRADTQLSAAIIKTIIGVNEGQINLTPKKCATKFV